jgi:hypothetical protein
MSSATAWEQVGDVIGAGAIGLGVGVLTLNPLAGIAAGSATLGGLEALEGAAASADAAKTEADQQKQQDQLNQYQQIQNIDALQTQQSRTLADYQAQMQTQEQSETEGEQAAYTSAFSSIGSAEQQIGSEQAQAASGASSIVAGAAARNLKVGPGAVQSAGSAGQGQQLSMTPGVNGAAAGAGSVAKTAEDALSGTNPVSGATDSAAGITAATGSQVTPAVAATPAQLSVTPGQQNIYDPASSPLTQLAAYERNANLQIGQEQAQIATAGNAQLKGIANQTANFETGQQQGLLGFEQNQENQLESAYLGESQSASAMTQQENFTQQNLSNYDSSLWLNAFSSILSESASAFGKMYTPPTYSETEASLPDYMVTDEYYTDYAAWAAGAG